jgi:hypothetical protein
MALWNFIALTFLSTGLGNSVGTRVQAETSYSYNNRSLIHAKTKDKWSAEGIAGAAAVCPGEGAIARDFSNFGVSYAVRSGPPAWTTFLLS